MWLSTEQRRRAVGGLSVTTPGRRPVVSQVDAKSADERLQRRHRRFSSHEEVRKYLHPIFNMVEITVSTSGVCPSVCLSAPFFSNLNTARGAAHTQRDLPGVSMRRGQCTFRPDNKEYRHTCMTNGDTVHQYFTTNIAEPLHRTLMDWQDMFDRIQSSI